jgi:hypothetical protein
MCNGSRDIRLVTRNKVVGSLGPDGRLKFLSADQLKDAEAIDVGVRKLIRKFQLE